MDAQVQCKDARADLRTVLPAQLHGDSSNVQIIAIIRLGPGENNQQSVNILPKAGNYRTPLRRRGSGSVSRK
jgi:hypothetical protein